MSFKGSQQSPALTYIYSYTIRSKYPSFVLLLPWTPATQNTVWWWKPGQIVHSGQSVQVQSNSLQSGWGLTMRQTCRGIQGDHSQVKNLRADLTFLVKILSDFTELPIARKKKSVLFYVFSLTVSVLVCLCVSARVCMCVCICFRACMGIGVIRKGKRVQWVTD